MPLQGPAGRLRSARAARAAEPALPQPRRRHVRGRLRSVRHHAAPAAPTASASSTLDFDNDGWTDIYVANDSNPSALYRNNHDGTFTDIGVDAGCAYSQDGKPQAGMGVADRRLRSQRHDGHLQDELRRRHVDALRATPATASARTARSPAASGLNTRWLGWGAGFVDFDNDGWLDLFLANGHVYPEVRQLKTEAGYEQRKVVYRNLGNGRFADVTRAARAAGRRRRRPARGAAFGDFDNDGDVDVAITNVNDTPDLFRLNGDPAAITGSR